MLPSGESLARGALHIYRTKILTESTCYDRLTVHNYGERALELDLKFEFAADFADIFEVRGATRRRRGSIDPEKVEDRAVTLAYTGLDGIGRETRVACCAANCAVREGEISVPVQLEVQSETSLTLIVEFGQGPLASQAGRYDETLHRLDARRAEGPLAEVEIETSNE